MGLEPLVPNAEAKSITVNTDDGNFQEKLNPSDDTIRVRSDTKTTTTRESRTLIKDAGFLMTTNETHRYPPNILTTSSSNEQWESDIENLEIKVDSTDEYSRVTVTLEDGTIKQVSAANYNDSSWVSVGSGTIDEIAFYTGEYTSSLVEFGFRGDVKVETTEIEITGVSSY